MVVTGCLPSSCCLPGRLSCGRLALWAGQATAPESAWAVRAVRGDGGRRAGSHLKWREWCQASLQALPRPSQHPGTMAQQLSDEQGAWGESWGCCPSKWARPLPVGACQPAQAVPDAPAVPLLTAVAEFKEAFSLFGENWLPACDRRLLRPSRALLTPPPPAPPPLQTRTVSPAAPQKRAAVKGPAAARRPKLPGALPCCCALPV